MLDRILRLMRSTLGTTAKDEVPDAAHIQQSVAPEQIALSWSGNGDRSEKRLTAVESDLLLRSHAQWQSGDWHGLLALTDSEIISHPARAILAALASTGRMQAGTREEARKYLHLAIEWGCDKRLINALMITGVHESLGRASVIAGRQDAANMHFNVAARLDLSRLGKSAGGATVSALSASDIWKPVLQARERSSDLPSAYPKTNRIGSISLSGTTIARPAGNYPIPFVRCDNLGSSDNDSPLSGRAVSSVDVQYGNSTLSLLHRSMSEGDLGVIKQIFEEKQYEFGWLPQGKKLYQLHKNIVESKRKPLIIDAGANIGASTLWFNAKFANSTVVAIEPDLDNSTLIQRNCAGKDVLLYVGGIADRIRTMYLQDPGESDWGFRVVDRGDRAVPCIGIADVLRSLNVEQYAPLVLKVDIEGGEALAFEGSCKWMTTIPMIIIELHDWMLPNKKISRNFLEAVNRYGFEVIGRGENLFCFNPKLIYQ